MIKKMKKTLAVLSIVSLITIAGTCDFVMAQQRFIDHGNGTITDRKLGLQSWLENEFRYSIPQLYDNWRLPTVSELQSLFVEDPKYEGYRTDCGHPVRVVPQIRLSCILIWTSDKALALPLAFNFNIGNAFTIDLYDNKGCRVLPVRLLE
jgi:hypothetical protein